MQKAVLFRYPGSAGFNLAGLAYALLGYGAALFLITRPNIFLNLAGTLLLAHSLVICAYFIHEFVHGSIFTKMVYNDRGGAIMAWITGACFASYSGLKEKHLRHHADRLDVATFDYRNIVQSAPVWVQKTILALEWAYVPVIELLMHALVIIAQYKGTPAMRWRASLLIASRIAFFAVLAIIAPRALAWYAIAYLIMLQVLRFMDAFQHTYDVYVASSLLPAPAEKVRDRAYEHANTYTNVLSISHPLLNLLTLNFAYHNAHHARPAVPWHDLPALHDQLYGNDHTQVLTARELFGSYHRNRVKRVLAPDYGMITIEGDRAHDFLGAVGVSFLTSV